MLAISRITPLHQDLSVCNVWNVFSKILHTLDRIYHHFQIPLVSDCVWKTVNNITIQLILLLTARTVSQGDFLEVVLFQKRNNWDSGSGRIQAGSDWLCCLSATLLGWIHALQRWLCCFKATTALHDSQAWQTADFKVGYKPFQMFKFQDARRQTWDRDLWKCFFGPFEMRDWKDGLPCWFSENWTG